MFTGAAGGYLQASRRFKVAATLKGKDIRSDKASDRNDATGSSSICESHQVFGMISICAGHSRTFG